jgi:hypothetical protein
VFAEGLQRPYGVAFVPPSDPQYIVTVHGLGYKFTG